MARNDVSLDLEKVIEVFNEKGKEFADEFVQQEYGLSYQVVQKKIRNDTNYSYSRTTRKYELEENFMTMEELCNKSNKKTVSKQSKTLENNPLDYIDTFSDSFKEVIVNMMKDKIQEMSKYIYLEQSTKVVAIDIKKLESNGYTVVLN